MYDRKGLQFQDIIRKCIFESFKILNDPKN